MITCKNCGHVFEGNYCNQCRQAASTQRLTWREIFHQVRNATFDVDRGFFYTIKELLLRPGVTLRNYLEGKRVNLSNPFFFVLLSAGFDSLLFTSFNVGLPVKAIRLDRIEKLSPLVAQKYFVLVGIIFIIMLTATDRVLYRRARLKFSEHLISNTFQAGLILALTVAFFPFLLLQDRLVDAPAPLADVRLLFKLLILGYFVRARYQFFKGDQKARTLLVAFVQIASLVLFYELVIAGMIARWMMG